MDTSPIGSLTKKLQGIRTQIDGLERDLADLRAREHRIQTAIEVITEETSIDVVASKGGSRLSVKSLVLSQLRPNQPTSRKEIAKALKALGHDINPNSLGGTLFALVRDGYATSNGKGTYLRKGEARDG